jgi:hypothetical protein
MRTRIKKTRPQRNLHCPKAPRAPTRLLFKPASTTLTALTVLAAGVLLALIPSRATGAQSPGDLCLYGSDTTVNTGIAMAGTRPAIGALAGGAEVAFQNASDQLSTYADTNGALTNTGASMDPLSSPSLASDGSAVAIAINSASDQLETDVNGVLANTGQAMTTQGSPAVAMLSSSSFEYAFIGNGSTFTYGDGTNWTGTDQGGASGSSTSITRIAGGWEATFKANTEHLYTYDSSGNSTDSGQVLRGNLGALTALGASGDDEIAYRDINDTVAGVGSALSGSTNEPMSDNTEASIAAFGSGTGYEIAYEGANDDLWLYGSAEGNLDTGQAMIAQSSPAITATSAGYEVAYECAPPAPSPPATTTTTAPVTTTVTTTTPATVTTTTPTSAAPPKSSIPRIRARFELKVTWTGKTSHLTNIKLEHKLPPGTLIRFTCRGSKHDRCPKLGTLPKRKRTLARELAVIRGAIFRHDDVLTITISAPHYRTEIISVRFPGNGKPRYALAWR